MMSNLQIGIAAILFSCLLILSYCSGKNAPKSFSKIPLKSIPRVVSKIPHDTTAFSQGLLFHDGKLFESAGLYNRSRLQVIDTNGILQKKQSLEKRYFAEGCALFKNLIYQITWKEQTCFIYSPSNLQCIDTLSYYGQGWGLTSNESHLIMSNGSDTLFFRNERFDIIRKLPVTFENKPLTNINELEYAQGSIFANVWFSDYIFKINPQSGEIQGVIDCSPLVAQESPISDQSVLNGIAYNPQNNFFYITGKNWKNIFVVVLSNTH